ncbi:hypothetical protein PINS_up013975 [Pythium insidiosum]|nr:hypothetical protein PINS_up013975 [Pythium insidiosum]
MAPASTFIILLLLFALQPQTVDAQVIAAPDKGDELESRAYTEGQGRLNDTLRARELSGLIDINVYTYVGLG